VNMPFGKYKGTPLAGVPSSYLRWLLRERISRTLRDGIEQVLGTQPTPPRPQRPQGDAIEPTRWAEVLSTEELERWFVRGVKRKTRQAIERELVRRGARPCFWNEVPF